MKGIAKKSSSRVSRKSFEDDSENIKQPALPRREGSGSKKKHSPEMVPWKLENERRSASQDTASSKTKLSYSASSNGKQAGASYYPQEKVKRNPNSQQKKKGRDTAATKGPSYFPNDPESLAPDQDPSPRTRTLNNNASTQSNPGAVAVPGIGVSRSGVLPHEPSSESFPVANRQDAATVTLEAEVAPDLTEVIAEAEERARQQEREKRQREQQQQEVLTATIVEQKRIMGMPRPVFWVILIVLIIGGVIVGVVISMSSSGGGSTRVPTIEPTAVPTISPSPTAIPTFTSAPSGMPSYSQVVWTKVAKFQNNATSNFGRTIGMSDDASRIMIGDGSGDIVSYVPATSGGSLINADLNSWILEDTIPGGFIYGNADYGIAFELSNAGDVVAIANPQSDSSKRLEILFFTGQNWLPISHPPALADVGPTRVDEYLRGEFLALAGQTSTVMAIGDLNKNEVNILARDGGDWGLRETISFRQTSEFAEFGYAVDLSNDGSVLAVGARTGGPFQEGLVFVYDWDGSNYNLRGGTALTGENADDRFGFAVKLSQDGTVVAAGANFNDDGGRSAGSVRVFAWDGEAWGQRGGDLDGKEAFVEFGRVVALNRDGSILAASSIYQEPSGTVYIFRWTGKEWIPWGDTLDGTIRYGDFGSDLVLSADGNVLLVSEPQINLVTLYQSGPLG